MQDGNFQHREIHKFTSFRWLICALLFFGLLVNYIDRQILSLLKPMLDERLHWTSTQFGLINSAFQVSYAISLFGFGWLVDRFGTKFGYSISIVGWSIAAIGHAAVGSISGFLVARVGLGLAEGGSFPSSVKAVAIWFPQRERALATSLFNSGANVGALLAPALVPFIAIRWGWQAAFVAAGLAGFIWLVAWLLLYEVPERSRLLTTAEFDVIREGSTPDVTRPQERPPLSAVLRCPEAWSFVVGKTLTDPVWWFFLIWLPDYFKSTRHLEIKNSWLHLVTIYSLVTVLSVAGGWVPGRLQRLGFSSNAARKLTMLASAICVLPIIFATRVGDWSAVLIIGLAAAAHQAWSANLYSTVADMFPKSVVAGLVGFGSMAGSAGAVLFPVITGIVLDEFKKSGNPVGGYTILFATCAFAYLTAFGLQHFFLARRFDPVPIKCLQLV